ncbi:YihY/virulence factor BrkB family protein [Agromyces salentinus]|uniref:YihY/virulence factor BrkB family protein n=1 Tax=Agromyces salentinus TaxID=269421 RepID=A0ABN2MWY7_9MICO|nr:YihY/virulence factor BrkB family protein [Agromyces salentinus]
MSERASSEPGDAPDRHRPATRANGAGHPETSTPLEEAVARSARERLDELSEPLRERFEQPINRVTSLTNRTLALLPVRVWRYFLAQNGFILSSGMSYQALFGVFAAVYVVFAVFGIWFTNNDDTMEAFALLLNTYAPGLIGDEGIISTDELVAITSTSTGTLGWTGGIALIGFIWTAIGWVTYTRIGVRSIFGLPKDTRSYALLKARDLVAGLMFGAVLLLASALSVLTTGFVTWLLSLIGVERDSGLSAFFVQVGAIVVVFVIDTLALAVLFRYLSGAEMPWRRMVIGSVLGSAALSVMQLLGGVLIGFASSNPLLATFAVFIALLFWFRMTSIVILVAASWIAVEASDANETLLSLSPEQLEAERHRREAEAALTVARVRLREAEADAADANWLASFAARRRVAKARLELDEAEAAVAKVASGRSTTIDVGRLE